MIEGSNETDPENLDYSYNGLIETGGIVSHILKENSISDLNIALGEKLRLIIVSAKIFNS